MWWAVDESTLHEICKVQHACDFHVMLTQLIRELEPCTHSPQWQCEGGKEGKEQCAHGRVRVAGSSAWAWEGAAEQD
jgi:hypothetical protein